MTDDTGAAAHNNLGILAFSHAEIAHLLNLLSRNKDDGTYYGPHIQYWERAARITTKLEAHHV